MKCNHEIRTWGLVLLIGFGLFLLAPVTHAVVKDIGIVDGSGNSLANTKVTIVFPDGTEQEGESDDDGMLVFDFPSDGNYRLRHSGGQQTVTVTGAGAAAGSGGFLAWSWDPFSFIPATDTGGYLGVGFSYNDHGDVLSANNDGSLSNISDDDTGFGFGIIGGYFFNDFVGVEGGYLDLGEADFTAESDGSGDSWVSGDVATDFDADGWLFAVVGRWPITERLALLGRLGLFSWETTETFTENGFVSIDKNSDSDAFYGLGFEYDVGVGDKWVLRGDVARTKVDDDHDDVNMGSVSAVRKF